MTRASLLLLLAAVGGAIACNAILGIEDVQRDPGPGDASVGDSGQDTGVVVDPTCEPSPRDDASVIREACGIFAAPNGSDDKVGSRTEPVRTVRRAIELAVANRLQRVYLCAASYTETLRIGHDEAIFGMSVYGALTCPATDAGAGDAWSLGDKRASVQPTGPGVALRVDNAPGKVTLDGIDFVARDAEEAGKSSVAGYVSSSTSVVLRHASFTAGNGKAGTRATAPIAQTQGDPSGSAGDNGGGAKSCRCEPSGISSGGGGGGGDEFQGGGAGSPGGALGGLPVIDGVRPKSLCGANGEIDGAHDGGSGTPGANGADGKHGADAGAGVITPEGWQSASGIAGETGVIGQGGGGGRGGSACAVPRGGGGGCGSCGGTGGGGGGGGGASIALLVKDAKMSLGDVALTAKDGANGGAGMAGLEAAAGGARGEPGREACACPGGAGGNGGRGGSGGGGSGGLSVGILYSGEPPALDPKMPSPILVRNAGQGGNPGAGAAAGHPGIAQQMLNVKDL